jgi:hypothetical protein
MTVTASLLRFAKANDQLTLLGAILSSALILVATIIGWKNCTKINNISTASSSTDHNDHNKERNEQARKRAAEAAAKRQSIALSNPKVKKKKLKYLPPPHSEKVTTPSCCAPASTAPLIDQPNPPIPMPPMPVFDDGMTCFRHIPHLPHADSAAAILKRLAREFMPIIRQRGYDVRSVSEFCCCGDGLDCQLGGRRFCVVRRGGRIAGHDESTVGGYNLLEQQSRRSQRVSQRVHTIHVRLRSSNNHEYLLPYKQAVRTMAHELAHCIYRHHEMTFHALMQELLEQHAMHVLGIQYLGVD